MAKLKTGRHTSALKEARKAKKNCKKLLDQKQNKNNCKKVEEAVKNNDAKLAQERLNVAFSEWDKAAKSNVIHYKAASNQKARLSKKVAAISK